MPTDKTFVCGEPLQDEAFTVQVKGSNSSTCELLLLLVTQLLGTQGPSVTDREPGGNLHALSLS